MCAAPAADMREACGGCPLARGCAAVCCPRCGYQFVERSATIDLLLRMWGGARARLAAAGKAGLT